MVNTIAKIMSFLLTSYLTTEKIEEKNLTFRRTHKLRTPPSKSTTCLSVHYTVTVSPFAPTT